MKIFKHVLMNEVTDETQGSGGDIMSEISDELSIDMSEDVSLEAAESEDVETNETETNVESVSELDKLLADDSGDNEEKTELEDEGEDSWLDEIKNLDLRDQGEAFEVQSKEHLQELIQKGHNFTQKTQALADERKTFETEREQGLAQLKEQEESFSQMYEQVNEQLTENQIIEIAVTRMQAEDPDLFAELQAYYKQAEVGFSAQRNNPEVQKLQKEVQDLKQGVQQEKSSYVMKQFDLEYEQSNGLISELKDTLGLEIDKDVVKKEWANGKDVRKAILSEYGDKILKLKNSKEKVAKVKQKKPVTLKKKAPTKLNKLDWNKDSASLIDDIASFF